MTKTISYDQLFIFKHYVQNKFSKLVLQILLEFKIVNQTVKFINNIQIYSKKIEIASTRNMEL